jgi:hypothetical protein
MPTTLDHPLTLWPSRALLTFVQRQVSQNDLFIGKERRTEERLLVAMPVLVQGVDEQLAPVGEPQAMVVRDFTRQGLGLVHDQPFPHSRIVVRLTHPEEGTLLAAEVRWNKPLGPFYHLGCQVVAQVERFAPFEP